MNDIDNNTSLKIEGLEKILKALKAKKSIKIGILGDKNARTEENSNAEIGARFEFGVEGQQQRSFLRMPLSQYLFKNLQNAGLVDKETLKEVIKEGSLVPYLKKIAIVAEGTVLQAFDTGGFGEWPPSNMDFKKNHQTLVETGQLRNSITSRIDNADS